MWGKILEVLKKVGGVLLISFVTFFMFVFFGEATFNFDNEPVVDEYGYTEADDELPMEKLIEYYGGQDAYIYDEEYGVYLYLELDDELHYIIDDSVSDEYVALFDIAITHYNDLGFINISYERGDTVVAEDAEYYYAVFQVDAFEDDMQFAMGYNEIAWDVDGNIFYSVINLSWEVYENYDQEVIIALLVHEIAHTFGLKDIYDLDFEDDSLMFYADSEVAVDAFTEFDIFNLAFLYLEEGEVIAE
jgi:hypothetical protein